MPDDAEAELSALMVRYLAGSPEAAAASGVPETPGAPRASGAPGAPGAIDAFDALYAALSGRIRGYLLSLCRDSALADDLLQETFMQVHRSRRTYEPGRPVTPWVFAIARHVFLMHRRGTARRLRFEATLAGEMSGIVGDDRAALTASDEVRRALRDVPADQRQALLMHHVGGHSFADIAQRLGIRANAAKTRAFRGMRKMRERLGK